MMKEMEKKRHFGIDKGGMDVEEIIVCYMCGKIIHVEKISNQSDKDIHVVYDICHDCLSNL